MPFWNFLSNIWESLWIMLSQIVLSDRTDERFKVYVKTNVGRTVPVILNDDSSVKDVKKVVSNQLGTCEDDITIIFSGRELQDNTILKDCDLGNQSVLHAVKSKAPIKRSNTQVTNSLHSSLPISFEQALNNTVNFFVYCSSNCKDLRKGKLRVKCTVCNSGAFTVHSDPTCWDDVLLPNRIKGNCPEDNCQGKFAKFFFKCAEHVTFGEEDEAIPLKSIRSNIHSMPCLACMEIRTPMFLFDCPAGHLLCIECFATYCTVNLRERRFVQDFDSGYTIGCPVGCFQSLIQDVHHFKLMGVEMYQRFHRFGAEEFVLQSGGVLCPQINCGMGLLPQSDCRRIVCEMGCNYVFCRDCLEGYHIGECNKTLNDCTYQDGSILNMHSLQEWDKASKAMIQVTTKPCPSCRTPTERSGGCMHMICGRAQCKFEWCWVCQVEWTRECMANHWFG